MTRVASQRVFIVVFVSLSTQFENFWIHPRSLTDISPPFIMTLLKSQVYTPPRQDFVYLIIYLQKIHRKISSPYT